MLRKKLEERGVAEIFFQVSPVIEVFRIDLRHRQAMPAKVAGKFKKRGVLFANVIQNSDRADRLRLVPASVLAGQANDFSPRTSQLSLQSLNPRDRRMEVLLEKMLEKVHELGIRSLQTRRPKISREVNIATGQAFVQTPDRDARNANEELKRSALLGIWSGKNFEQQAKLRAEIWWRRLDSNQRPPVVETVAGASLSYAATGRYIGEILREELPSAALSIILRVREELGQT